MSTIGERIKGRRLQLNLTLLQVADFLGVKEATAQRYESGEIKNIKHDTILKLSECLSCTPAYLMGWEDEIQPNEKHSAFNHPDIYPITYKKFRVLGEIACGKPIYADEDRETVILADSKIDADFCLYAKGDSMIGARIMDGDIIFIKQQPTVDNGEIAAVIIDDEATLKRVYYYPDKNKLILNAENPKYEPLVYIGDELNTIRILGKAVAFQSAVR